MNRVENTTIFNCCISTETLRLIIPRDCFSLRIRRWIVSVALEIKDYPGGTEAVVVWAKPDNREL